MTGPLTRCRVLVVAVVLGVVFAGLGLVPAAADPGAEGDFVGRINAARAARGVGGLQQDAELTAIARRWSQRMANDQRLSHNPNLATEVDQDWEKLAENVGFGGEVATIHDAFMNSSAHRANILDGALTHVGVGVVVDGSGQLWVTQVFMRLRGGGGGGGTAPPTTAAPPPPTTARPRPAPTPTTARPAPPPPPGPTPNEPPTTAVPEPPAPDPEPVAAPEPAPAPDPPAVAPSGPSPRLVLVLDRLVALDDGR